MTKPKKPMAEILAEYLERHALTQTEFARISKVPQGDISKILHGKRNVGLRTFERLVNVLEAEVSLSDLLMAIRNQGEK